MCNRMYQFSGKSQWFSVWIFICQNLNITINYPMKNSVPTASVRWVALLVFGDGWHNNHHAFEYSARHGLEWWQLDLSWLVIRSLQTVGLAWDVKLPTAEAMAEKRLRPLSS
jgi:fatty-acid desaturase